MKKFGILALSLVGLSAGASVLTAGAAFADGDGPFGVPQSINSVPRGFENGTPGYEEQRRVDAYYANEAAVAAAAQARTQRSAANATPSVYPSAAR